jgi:dUTP pyrophosphatase
MNKLKVQIKILDPRMANFIPAYATPGSAAVDLRACLDAPLHIHPGDTRLINTGISIYTENAGVAAILIPRSGLGHKHGIVLGNLIGLIDSDYQGELLISCWNRNPPGGPSYTIKHEERIAQLMFISVMQVNFELVTEFEETQRGTGGFGHTGTD